MHQTDGWARFPYFAVKNHRWLDGVFQNANQEFFPLDETWSWAGNISATYRLPYNVSVSGFLQSKSGVKGQRTNIFRTADPDGGPRDRQQRQHDDPARTVRFTELSAYNILNFRANKDFRHGRRPEARPSTSICSIC